RLLPKQQGREAAQIVTPNRPCVSTWVLRVRILNSHLIKLRHHDLTVLIGDVFLPAHRNPKAFEIAVNCSRILLHECVFRIRNHGLITPPSRTEYAEIAEHIRISYASVQGMEPTHRQTCKSSIGSTWCHPEVTLHEGDHYLLEFHAEHHKRLLSEGTASGWSHVGVDHHDEHRHRFVFGN